MVDDCDDDWPPETPEDVEAERQRVYRAFDPQLRRHVALKFLSGTDPTLAQRFLNEAQAQARVDHDHVCKVFEVGDVDGRLYIAMQYVAGLR